MQWLSRDEFWLRWDGRTDVSIDYVGWCYFEIAEAELRARIGNVEPATDLRGEANPPGPVLRWYGDLDDVPVLVDFHLGHPHGEVVEVHHGTGPGAREAVRAFFSGWGSGWEESATA